MNLCDPSPELIEALSRYAIPGTVIGSIVGLAAAIRLAGGPDTVRAFAEVVRALWRK